MSGNLKILVHKSWHVWKRENREKVARDERNFKEDNERKEEKQKNLLQERNLELLQLAESQQQVVSRDFNAEDHSAIGSDDNEKVHIDKPFRLFGDIEELDKRTNEIKDQIRAAKDKELNDKKRSGEAPWALGEGAAEKIGEIELGSTTVSINGLTLFDNLNVLILCNCRICRSLLVHEAIYHNSR